jgi:superfamily II DNA or RNA helicase
MIKLRQPFNDVLYSMGASRTQFLVYQFQPVLKFVQSLPHGLLIADEVGLGKTIEAGLILKELVARGSVSRVLVLCPANLRQKWQSEMQQRFGFEFRFINASDLRKIRADYVETGWPDLLGIASLEGLRRDELREILSETGITFDLVIVDEAHHLRNPTTLSFAIGELLSDQSDCILLLSATPVQTGAQDLLSLLQLVDPAYFRSASEQFLNDLLEPNQYVNRAIAALSLNPPDVARALAEFSNISTTAVRAPFSENPLYQSCAAALSSGRAVSPTAAAEIRRDMQKLHTLAPYFSRTRKREVQQTALRRSIVRSVRPSTAERDFYRALFRYLRLVAQRQMGNVAGAWALSMRERQAASSLQAVKRILPQLLGGQPPTDVESSDPELTPETQAVGDDGPSLQAARRAVEDAAVDLGSDDTKLGVLCEMLQSILADPSRKVLLFTFFKGTLAEVRRGLEAHRIAFESISGDDKPESRADKVQRFRESSTTRVLLSTEVGAEGLDFQFCDTVVNYDLPWNPMRVEQRIGRIDRFGQRAPYIDVISMFVEETIDTRILQRLYDRIGVFERSIGELEPILGPIVRELQAGAFKQELDAEGQKTQVDLAVQRAENLRIQAEEFESARAELIGHTEWMEAQVVSARNSGRYLTPQELEALVAQWLIDIDGSYDEVKPTAREGVIDLRLSPATIGSIHEWMNANRRNEGGVRQFLQRISSDGHAWCTFDGEVAQEYDRLPFLDASHPVVRVAIQNAGARGSVPPFERIGTFSFPASSQSEGPHLLFVYRLQLTGAEERTLVMPVAVHVLDTSVDGRLGDELLGFLAEAPAAPRASWLTLADLRERERVAFEYANLRRAEITEYASSMQESRLAVQKTAIERSFLARISRKRETLASVADPRIRRLHEGEIRKLEGILSAKLGELAGKPRPVGTLNLESVALFYPPEWQL